MPPISEYENNAPKFSTVMMPFPAINAPNLVINNLNLINSWSYPFADLSKSSTSQTDISSLIAHRHYYRYKDLPMDWLGRSYLISSNGYLHFIRPSAIWLLQDAADGPTRRSRTVKYLWIMTASCQITCTIPWLPCEQLPYLPEHPQISRMRQRDKSDLPLPVLSYK